MKLSSIPFFLHSFDNKKVFWNREEVVFWKMDGYFSLGYNERYWTYFGGYTRIGAPHGYTW